jgi:hypothetical protein
MMEEATFRSRTSWTAPVKTVGENPLRLNISAL